MAKGKQVPARQDDLTALLNKETIQQRFKEMLGRKAPGFISSIISAVNQNPELKKADPMSIISAAAIAASLDLPINPNLQFACIVPYSGRAQFQMQWRGFVQLALRSGQYRTINVAPFCVGELKYYNKFTGEMEFDERGKTSDKVEGYVAFFRLLNGFEKYFKMTVAEAKAHGIRYSKSYNNPQAMWQKSPEMMSMKTVIKQLLSKWGILSIEMQEAIRADQAVVKETGEYEYIDNPDEGPKGDVTETPDFDQLVEEKIKAGADISRLKDFISKVEESIKGTKDEGKDVKIEATKDFDNFWTMFEQWLKTADAGKEDKGTKKKGRPEGSKNKPKPEKLPESPDGSEEKYVQCPNKPGDQMKVSFCDSQCKSREGCPSFS